MINFPPHQLICKIRPDFLKSKTVINQVVLQDVLFLPASGNILLLHALGKKKAELTEAIGFILNPDLAD